MDVYFPRAATGNQPVAGIVFVHGGGWVAGVRASLAASAQAAAEHGFVGFNLSYGQKPPRMAHEVGDILAAISDIRARAAQFHVDADRLGGLGASAGAQLIMQAAITDRAPLRAVAGWSGLYDLTTNLFGPTARPHKRLRLERSLHKALQCGEDQNRCHDAADSMSPARHATAAAPPTLLVNSQNEYIAVEQMNKPAAALRAQHRQADTCVLPGRRHAEAYDTDAIGPTLSFFAEHLRTKSNG